ncbi:MAG: hypothetical protein KKA61_00865 [Nanoarchaeota archaeon]|nr:hypothetical protein [Nanoarchaeota archaeon]
MRRELKEELKKFRALHLCEVVIKAYEEKFGLFSQPDIEDYMFPERQLADLIKDKDDLALWFFFTCPGDKLIDSRRYYKQLGEFYLKNPNFFRLNDSVFKPDINSLLKNVNVANPNEFLRTINENSEDLIKKFKGNPLNTIKEGDYDSCVKNLRNFLGYGKGMASLYLVFLSRYGIKKTKNIAPKVDRHLLRISAGCSVFKVTKNLRVDEATEEVSRIYTEICKEKSFDGTLLDALTYVIGRKLCSKRNEVLCNVDCPLDYYCSKQLPKIDKKSAILCIEKRKNPQLFLSLSPKGRVWNPDIPISYLQEDIIIEKFREHAGELYKDLKEHKQEVILVEPDYKRFQGQKLRASANQNPLWYRNLINRNIISRKPREEHLNTLKAISNGSDKEFKRFNYKYHSVWRNLIFERLTECYEAVYMGDLKYNQPPDEEVAKYFNVKINVNRKFEVSQKDIDTLF